MHLDRIIDFLKRLLKNEKFWIVITAIFTALAAFSATYQTFITQEYNKKTMMPILAVHLQPENKVVISNDGNGVAKIIDLQVKNLKANLFGNELITYYRKQGCQWSVINPNTPIKGDKSIPLLDCSKNKEIMNFSDLELNIVYEDVYGESYIYP